MDLRDKIKDISNRWASVEERYDEYGADYRQARWGSSTEQYYELIHFKRWEVQKRLSIAFDNNSPDLDYWCKLDSKFSDIQNILLKSSPQLREYVHTNLFLTTH